MATKPLTTSDFYTRMAFNPNLFFRNLIALLTLISNEDHGRVGGGTGSDLLRGEYDKVDIVVGGLPRPRQRSSAGQTSLDR